MGYSLPVRPSTGRGIAGDGLPGRGVCHGDWFSGLRAKRYRVRRQGETKSVRVEQRIVQRRDKPMPSLCMALAWKGG